MAFFGKHLGKKLKILLMLTKFTHAMIKIILQSDVIYFAPKNFLEAN